MKRDKQQKQPAHRTASALSRRRLLKASALSAATAGLYGVAPFYGPWKHHHAWAQTAQKKPLVLGLTMDASGQYAASGSDERLGAMLAIKEFNDKGGVLGRPIEHIHIDTETTPATGSRIVTLCCLNGSASKRRSKCRSSTCRQPRLRARSRADARSARASWSVSAMTPP